MLTALSLCSVRSDANGRYSFQTGIPGPESYVGWGPDPYPHYHGDFSGCNASYFNKFYLSLDYDFTIDRRLGKPDLTNKVMPTTTKNVFEYNWLLEPATAVIA